MAVADEVYKMKRKFHNKYNYLSKEQVDDLYECALNFYLSLSFPFNHEIMCIPEEYQRDVEMVRKIMVDTLERDGLSTVEAYSENGMSFTFDNANISSTLLSMIIPKVKVVNKK